MNWKNVLIKGGKKVAEILAPDVLNLGAKLGNELYEKQKVLIKIPDLKDVHINEALRILKDELNLIPTPVMAKPNMAYADESENEVMYSDPRFGLKVNPRTTIKVYYLTQEVIEKSKKLMGDVARDFIIPAVVGLNVYEAREDLEALGLRVTEKTEKPSLSLANKEEGQVTKITLPDNHRIGSKLKSGDRVWLYYMSEDVLLKCISLKDKRDKDKQEKIDKLGKNAEDLFNGIKIGIVETPHKLAERIKNPLRKKQD